MVRSIYGDDCVVSDRGGIIENRYNVHVAVVDANGKLLYAVGDPSRLTLARSAAKPAQALAVYETGGFEQAGFDDADLALMCASHNAEDRHIRRTQAMLAKSGALEADLKCGGHPSINEKLNRSWIKNDLTTTGIHNNCSGKHAGMLAGAKALKAGFKDYHLPFHPMQLQVRKVVEEMSNIPTDDIKWAIDGCNLPAPALPLEVLAKLYAFFATAADVVDDNMASPRMLASRRIFRAMAQHPELVGGNERFCTDLMEAYQGSLIGKVGADGCYGVGIRASEQTSQLGAHGAIGIAVKVEDGNLKILYSAVTEVLRQLGIGNADVFKKLAPYYCQDILNTMGVVTGRISHIFKIRPV